MAENKLEQTKKHDNTEVKIKELDSAPKVLEWIKDAINALIKLEIRTEIITEGNPYIHTVINLVDGDITTKLHTNLVPDKMNVADFHKEQVQKAEEIIERNVNTIKSIGEWLIDRL